MFNALQVQILVYLAILMVPHTAGAVTFSSFVQDVIRPLVDSFVAFTITLAVVAFVFGLVRFIAFAGDDKSRTSGKTMMLWGLLALLCIVSVWGLVEVVFKTFFG